MLSAAFRKTELTVACEQSLSLGIGLKADDNELA